MNSAEWIIGTVAVISLLISVLFLHEYLRVTRKRREFIVAIGGSGRAVPQWKHTLMFMYALSTIGLSVGIVIYFFIIVE